jgi:hypothetical protein
MSALARMVIGGISEQEFYAMCSFACWSRNAANFWTYQDAGVSLIREGAD